MKVEAENKSRVHQGRNVKRLREMLGIKQEILADKLHTTQQNISLMEPKEVVEEDILKKVSEILNVPVETIKNFNDGTTYNYINTFNDKVDNSSFLNNPVNCTFNPIDKIMNLYSEKEELYKEKEELYQKMLESEKEKNEFLKKLLDK